MASPTEPTRDIPSGDIADSSPQVAAIPEQHTTASNQLFGTIPSMLDAVQPGLLYPDLFTIVCFNEGFQRALDHLTIKTLLLVCNRARPLLSSTLPRFHNWCREAGLCNPDGQMRIGLTPSDRIALSQHYDGQEAADRSWLVVQADQGSAVASYFLARILQIDKAEINWSELVARKQKIARLYETAAHANHPMAQFHLAECFLGGRGVPQDRSKAFELYSKLAAHGILQAQIALGRCYEGGEVVEQDYNNAIEWYTKAADQGSEDGRLHIVFLRGWLSFIGHGVKQSDVDALTHWQEVSTQSSDPVIKPIATHMVGWMHYLGRGAQQDKQKGIKIIRENKSDEFKLGEDEGLGSIWAAHILSDTPAAFKFFQMCQLGSDRDWLCKHLMAVCLYHGFGTIADRSKMAGIFEELANEGHIDCQLWIGRCYYYGWGVSEDPSKAFEWIDMAASQGNPYAQWWAATCYFSGYGVTKDYAMAADLSRKSADQGNRHGQNSLGDYYRFGYGVAVNIEAAAYWYRKSAEQGCTHAIGNLIRLGLSP